MKRMVSIGLSWQWYLGWFTWSAFFLGVDVASDHWASAGLMLVNALIFGWLLVRCIQALYDAVTAPYCGDE